MMRYPDKSMSRSRLQRIYKKYSIHRKKIRLTKTMNYNAKKRLKKNIFNAKDQLTYHQNNKFRIIYIDETMITRSTIHSREFTLPY